MSSITIDIIGIYGRLSTEKLAIAPRPAESIRLVSTAFEPKITWAT